MSKSKMSDKDYATVGILIDELQKIINNIDLISRTVDVMVELDKIGAKYGYKDGDCYDFTDQNLDFIVQMGDD